MISRRDDKDMNEFDYPGPVDAGHAGALAVDVRGLVKSYSGTQAVRGIDLAIRQGEVFALLGPNGAGKTTTVEILEGYRTRDGGEVSVLGVDPGRQRAGLKSRIGIVLQSTSIDRYLTVRETIAMYATFYPHPRPVDEVIHLVGLEEKRDARVLKLSGGQQRRLDVAVALVGNPELLFLDEPTTGFDPSARHEAWEVIKNLASLGMTVLLTTHYMDEAQFLADRVAVIVAGQIVAEGPPATLGDRQPGQVEDPVPPTGRRDSPGRAVCPAGPGRLHRDHARRRGPGTAPAHRVGHRPRGQPRRAAGDEAVAGGRLSLAHRRRIRRRRSQPAPAGKQEGHRA